VTVTQDIFRATGVARGHRRDGELPAIAQGVEVAVLFREVNPTQYKIGLRSQGRVNVANVAEIFGGGGHRNAAGCTVKGDLATVKAQVLEAVEVATGGKRREPVQDGPDAPAWTSNDSISEGGSQGDASIRSGTYYMRT
jgi:nanoRNase/pAp phosphatase (c-di-AMP/oligoRNAs hydrolase)